MASEAPPSRDWHLDLSIRRDLWNHMLEAALPIRVASGRFDVVEAMRGAVGRLQVGQRVRGFLEESSPPEVVRRAQDRAVALWRNRKGQVNDLVDEVLKVEGDWWIQIEREGSSFKYAHRQVGLQAEVRVVVEGKARLVRSNVQFPFKIEKSAAAALRLDDIHYDSHSEQVVGMVGDVLVDIGENLVFELLGRASEYFLQRQIDQVNPLRILSRDQLEQLVAPAGGALKLNMGVEDLDLEVDDDNVSLKVRFGFTQKQLGDDAQEP